MDVSSFKCIIFNYMFKGSHVGQVRITLPLYVVCGVVVWHGECCGAETRESASQAHIA